MRMKKNPISMKLGFESNYGEDYQTVCFYRAYGFWHKHCFISLGAADQRGDIAKYKTRSPALRALGSAWDTDPFEFN